jgi:hemerythrin
LVFLNDWLRNHIANDDQLVAQHARRSVDRPIAEMMYAEFFPSTSAGNSS